MTPAFTLIDEITRVSTVGVRFWDPGTGVAVRDGLSLRVQGADPPSRVSVNPSGVFILTGLPGLSALESGSGDAAFWTSPPEAAAVVIEVDDKLARYLPCSFTVVAPKRGLAQPYCASALAAAGTPAIAGSLPLFSSAAQTFPSTLAVVRTWLWDAAGERPAAHGLLQVSGAGGVSSIGVADTQGRVVVALPYPPLTTNLASPPAGNALTAQSWTVDVSVSYDPKTAVSGTPGHPDLCALLGQPAAEAVATQSPPSSLTTGQLAYGEELVLTTDGEPYLLIEPSTSPIEPHP